jgi:hypothetical protein
MWWNGVQMVASHASARVASRSNSGSAACARSAASRFGVFAT